MSDWKVIQDLSAGQAMLAEVRERLTASGAEKIAAEAAVAMGEASRSAFAFKSDPRTGQKWAAPSEATLRDPRYRSLLVRTGELEGNIVSGYKVTPGGATAFVNAQASIVRLASIQLYGVSARAKRANKSYRDLSNAAMPSRRFVGLSTYQVNTIMADAEQIITGNL
jgi:phage gpG-like protein